MSTSAPHNQEDQEIDLSLIYKKIGSFFDGINRKLFRCIQFFIKNWIIITILLLVGTGVGMYLDKNQKTYDNQIMVSPNFGSTDYLYSKIDLIDSKIKDGDTVFLKNVVGINEPKRLKKIEIRPIADIYKFIENKGENFELLKLMAEDGDIKKIIEDNITSKNYKFHTIFFKTDRLTSDKQTVQPLLNYLNQSNYYKEVQKITVDNIKGKLIQNDTIISQIDGILNGFSNRVNSSQKSDKLVYYNENTQLKDIIVTKDTLIKESGKLKIALLTSDKIIKENGNTLNIKNTESINGKLKFSLPILFMFIYIMIRFFIAFYRKQSQKITK